MAFFLPPPDVTLERAPDGTLRAHLPDCCALQVEVLRAMPLSHEEKFVVLRDGGGRELGVLETMEGLAPASSELMRQALLDRYFLPRIVKIYELKEKFGSSTWDVETDRGRIKIHTKALHESISELEPGRFLLRDHEDNRFEIRNLNTLDEESKLRFAGKY